MTIVSFLSRRRRVLALCAATVALHFVTIDWLGARLGPQRSTAVQPRPSVMTAQLRLALPKRSASAEPPPELKPMDPAAPKPAPRPPRAPSRQPAVAEPVPQLDSGALTSQMAAIEQELAAPPELVQPGAAPQPPAVQSPADAAAAAVAAAAAATPAPADQQAVPPPPAPQVTRRYKVNLPPPAEFEMEMKRTDAKGQWNGEARMSWKTDGSKYKVGMDACIRLLVCVNLLELGSEGEIDDAGIAPVKFTEKRRNRSQTATHFVRGDGRITFSASERSFPLMAGAQDKATVPFQLGGIGRADVNQFGSDIDILVGDEKDASIYRFQLVGEEELATKLGRIVSWHLARPPKPGSYSARLDIWLAPGMNWFPVQIRNTEANGAVTTQTITKITLSDSAGK